MITANDDSKNRKLYGEKGSPKWKGWPIAATSRRIGAIDGGSCPPNCMFLSAKLGGTREGGGGCYAAGGPVGWVARKAGYDESDGARVAQFVKDLPKSWWIRHHVSGDFALNGKPDWNYINAVVAAHKARPDLTAWAYTHLWRELPADTFDGAFVVRASCESPADVAEARALGWQTVMVGQSGERRRAWKEGGEKYALCPEVAVGTACRYCGLCALANDITIVFPAHGTSQRKIDRTLEALTPLPMASD